MSRLPSSRNLVTNPMTSPSIEQSLGLSSRSYLGLFDKEQIPDEPTLGESLLHAGSQAVGAGVSTFGAVPTALGEVTRALHLPSFVPRELHRWGDAVYNFADETFPGDPRLQGDFWWDTVPEAVGSFGAFVLVGAASGPAAPYTVTGLAAATGIAEQYQRLKPFVDSGELTEESASYFAMLGIVPGVVEVLPVFRGIDAILGKRATSTVLKTFNKSLVSRLRTQLPFIGKEAGVLAFQEAITEAVGTIGQNAIERIAVNEERGLFDTAATGGAAGGVSGFLTGVITSAIGLHTKGRSLRKQSATEAGRQILIENAKRSGVITEAEADQLSSTQDVGLLFDLTQRRLDDQEARLEPIEPTTPAFDKGVRVWFGDREDSLPATLTGNKRSVSVGAETERVEWEVRFDKPTQIDSLPRSVSEIYAEKIPDDMLKGDFKGTMSGAWVPEPLLREMQSTGQYRVISTPDSVTYREKQALGNDEWINGLRTIRKGEPPDPVGTPTTTTTLGSELFEASDSAGNVRLALPAITARGYQRDPSKITADINKRHQIQTVQQQFIHGVKLILRDEVIDERKLNLERAADRYVLSVEKILGKSDDTIVGARRQIRDDLSTRIKAGEISKDRLPMIRKDLARVFRELKTIDPTLSQFDVIDVAPNLAVDPTLRRVLGNLRDKVKGDWRKKPFTEKLRASLLKVDVWLATVRNDPKSLEDTFKAGQARGILKETIKGLPGDFARPLLEALPDVKDLDGFRTWLTDARKASVNYIRSSLKGEILTLVDRKNLTNKKNPRYKDVVSFLTNWFKPDIKRISQRTGWNPLDQATIILPDGMTANERVRLDLADNPEGFEQISKVHRFYNQRWNKLIEMNVLTNAQARALRFIFAGIDPRVMGRVRDIDTEVSREGASGTFWPGTRVISLEKSGQATASFIHEFLHAADFLYLSQEQRESLIDAYNKHFYKSVKPSEEVIKRGWSISKWTSAHQIVFDVVSPTWKNMELKDVNYYASNYHEFFAEVGSRYLAGKLSPKIPIPSIHKELLGDLTDLVASLSNRKSLEQIFPEEIVKLAGKVVGGETSGSLSTLLEYDLMVNPAVGEDILTWFENGAFGPAAFTVPQVTKAVKDSVEKSNGKRLAISKKISPDQRELFRLVAMAINETGPKNKNLRRLLVKYSRQTRAAMLTARLGGFSPEAINQTIEEFKTSKSTSIEIPKGANPMEFLTRLHLRVTDLLSNADVQGVDPRLATLYDQLNRRLDLIQNDLDSIPEAGAVFSLEVPAVELPIKFTKTAQPRVDTKILKKHLDQMSIERLRHLRNRVASIVRDGKVEAGVYKRILKWNTEDDYKEAMGTLSTKALLSELRHSVETPLGIAKTVADPASIEGWLMQISGGDNKGLRRLLFNVFVKPLSRTQDHKAEARRFVRDTVSKVYGLDINRTLQHNKLLKHLNQKLSNGILRSEAMWAYLSYNDPGTRLMIERDGIESRGQIFDLQESLGLLTNKDKAFALATRRFFDPDVHSGWIETGFANHRLLRGFEAERSPQYYPSRRSVEHTRLPNDLRDFAEIEIRKSTGNLESRNAAVKAPFKLDGGILGAFYRTTSALGLYSEIAIPMYRAEKLVNNQDFRRDFTAKFGRMKWEQLNDYLKNIIGFVGHNPTTFDAAMTWIPHAWMASKIALNITSAIKQSFSLLTAMGDTVLEKPALLQALTEGAGFSKRIKKDMRDGSGTAYMRLEGNMLSEAMIVLGNRNPASRLYNLQNQAFVLQRLVDDWSLRVTWRAAEIMAEKRGLKGKDRSEFIRDKFEESLSRNQATTNPLYASPLEIEAKKHPTLRGVLALQRELNRLYNTVRRHVVTAGQNPSLANISHAANAIFWSGIANTTLSSGVSVLRLAAFGLPLWTLADFFQRSLEDLVGRWYVLGDVSTFFMKFGGKGQSYAVEQLLGPGMSIILDIGKTGKAIGEAVSAGSTDLDDATRYFKGGPRRGQDKFDRALEDAFDHGLSSVSAVLGLPFWGIWFQAKGLYNWKREDYRLMVHLETEYQRSPEGSVTRMLIGQTKERINKVHRLREKGLMTSEMARRQVVSLLRLDQATR